MGIIQTVSVKSDPHPTVLIVLPPHACDVTVRVLRATNQRPAHLGRARFLSVITNVAEHEWWHGGAWLGVHSANRVRHANRV